MFQAAKSESGHSCGKVLTYSTHSFCIWLWLVLFLFTAKCCNWEKDFPRMFWFTVFYFWLCVRTDGFNCGSYIAWLVYHNKNESMAPKFHSHDAFCKFLINYSCHRYYILITVCTPVKLLDYMSLLRWYWFRPDPSWCSVKITHRQKHSFAHTKQIEYLNGKIALT